MRTNALIHYIYIVQALLETGRCKIGITNNLDARIKQYNNMTGKSKDNVYQYLFACEVSDMAQVENAIKENFKHLREQKSREIYFYNSTLFDEYVNFIKQHPSFIQEILSSPQPPEPLIKIVKKTTPSLKQRGLTKKDVMQKAQEADNDEFYTRYEDIEKEIGMYDKSIWEDKVVFCNCDDAVGSKDTNTLAFALFFLKNFKELGLKKLICTHYNGGVDLFNAGTRGYVFTWDGFSELASAKKYPRGYSGSFDDPLSLKILNEEADIVCTNPPFSKAMEYWKILIYSGKKFLIISNESNAINTAYIPYFMDNKVWTGYNSVYEYLNYKTEIVRAAGRWFTNLPVKNRTKSKNIKIVPIKEIPDSCKKYDDSKMLLLDRSYIPSDYKKPFAVSAAPILNGLLEMGYKIVQDKRYTPYTDSKECFARVLVQKV